MFEILELLPQIGIAPDRSVRPTGRGNMKLTPRETQVLDLFDRGCLWKQIGTALKISTSTAKTHGLHARLKLGAVSMREATWRVRNPDLRLKAHCHVS